MSSLDQSLKVSDPGAAPGDAAAQRDRRSRRRRTANLRFRLYGLAAIVFSVGMLATLVVSLIMTGYPAFTQTMVRLDIQLPASEIDAAAPSDANYGKFFRDALYGLFPEVKSPPQRRNIARLVTQDAEYMLRDTVVAYPSMIGKTHSIEFTASDILNQLHIGAIDRELPSDRRQISDAQIAWYDKLVAQGRIRAVFNTALFTEADSRHPEIAGLWGAITGSFYALLVCFVLSFPMGIAAAVYLEEFAPKNRWTDLIEININNLAAVPSIVFGLLGLAVFLNFFGLPRSAPLVGGMVLALMTLPTIIIAGRAAIKAVPPSIREAALGVGASHQQVAWHHTLPLAMPGILTGTIIGLAQALGETAPLLLIGMNAFITQQPGGILEPATALPTQIYIWADSPERGFVSRTSAAILVLLGFLVLMNGVAVWMRKRFERRW
jgi:phosphate transport system permease protein